MNISELIFLCFMSIIYSIINIIIYNKTIVCRYCKNIIKLQLIISYFNIQVYLYQYKFNHNYV